MKYTKIFIAIFLVLSSLLLSSCAALPKDLFFESTTATDKTPTGTTDASEDTPASTTASTIATGSSNSNLPAREDHALCDSVTDKGNGFYLLQVTSGTPGYKTIDGVTYFYIKCYVPAYPHAYFTSTYARSYDNYQAVLRYSTDLSNFRLASEAHGYDDNGSDGRYFSFNLFDCTSGYIYISYCAISNCEDPVAVQSDLVTNVWSNTDYFKVCISNAAG